MDVIVVGLDAVSRLNFHRQLPKTIDFLKNDLGAIEYFGYNKVGDNTFPNLIPMLTGENCDQLTQSCWHNNSDHFDNCSFLWSRYHQEGYATAFAEDGSWMGIFNYLKSGFIKQPVTHMYGVLDRQAQQQIGHQGFNSRLCQGVKLTVTYLLEHALRFVRTYQTANKNYFGFFWQSTVTHDTINYDPKIDVIYRDFLKEVVSTGALRNSIVLFISDHGIRWGGILNTYQGRLEERLPFLFVSTPKWFKEKYPASQKNLEENARKLTTPFDVHETLKAIVNRDFSSDPVKASRGVSLFKPVPVDRTCKSAGIPPHWCTCQESSPVDTDSKVARLAVDVAINNINQILANHSYCAKVILDTIIDASVSKSGNFTQDAHDINYYTVVFQSRFVGAVFEATVKCSLCDDVKDFEMAGRVSRNNLYGHQGDCVKDATLRLYCFCKL